MGWLGKLSTAQQVRLWFLAACELLGVILTLVAVSDLNYVPYLGVTVAGGNTVGVVAWVFLSQVAVVTLAIITGYRLIHPKTPHICNGGETHEHPVS